MRHTIASLGVVLFAVALVFSSACNQEARQSLVFPDSVPVNSKPIPSGSLSVTLGFGPVATVTWATSAENGEVQVCVVTGPDCVYREIARGTSGQIVESQLPRGTRRYRLLGKNQDNPTFVVATQQVVVN